MQQAQIRRTASSTSQPKEDQPLVMIVDDDAAVREALHELMLSASMQPVCFASTRELLNAGVLDRPGCLILDVRMPGASGLDLQHQLAASGNPKPIIFLTGHGDIPMTVQAMKRAPWTFSPSRSGTRRCWTPLSRRSSGTLPREPGPVPSNAPSSG